MTTENQHVGSDFEDFLREEGILEEVTEAAEAKVQTSLRFHESALHATYPKEVADSICEEIDNEKG